MSGDVIKENARKFENVQKVVGDMMRGALIETSARTILSQGISQTQRETAFWLLKRKNRRSRKLQKIQDLA